MATMGTELDKNIQFARENKGETWVGQRMLGTGESEHIACANTYLVAVRRIIGLEDKLAEKDRCQKIDQARANTLSDEAVRLQKIIADHKMELMAMVRIAAGEGQAPREFFIALDKLLKVGVMAMELLEEHHK